MKSFIMHKKYIHLRLKRKQEARGNSSSFVKSARAVMIHVVSSYGSGCVTPAVVCTCNSRKEKHRPETKSQFDCFSVTMRLRTRDVCLHLILYRCSPEKYSQSFRKDLKVSNMTHICTSSQDDQHAIHIHCYHYNLTIEQLLTESFYTGFILLVVFIWAFHRFIWEKLSLYHIHTEMQRYSQQPVKMKKLSRNICSAECT